MKYWLGDRRRHRRFEISGQLWASLDVTGEMTLQDISMDGALVEAPASRLWASARTVTVALRDDVGVTAVVRHVRPVPSDPPHQLIGLQFVHVSPIARAALERLVSHV